MAKLSTSQLTKQVMSKVFGLFPDTYGRFHNVDDLPMWTVSGELINPHISSVPGLPGIMPYSYKPPTASKASKTG